jgi:hypothetical protein
MACGLARGAIICTLNATERLDRFRETAMKKKIKN